MDFVESYREIKRMRGNEEKDREREGRGGGGGGKQRRWIFGIFKLNNVIASFKICLLIFPLDT